ncbi:MAG TPA: hypothetical protein VFN30_07530 [Chitinophagaceae bacterium]|nr:hypothetical protein [Chitinophagaceae bacterium]
MLKRINSEIKEAALVDTNKFLYKFLEHEDTIVNELRHFDGLQSELYLNQNPDELQLIKFASIFTDFISLYAGGHPKNSNHITFFDEGSPYNYDRQLTIPARLSMEINPNSHLLPCYSHNGTPDIQKAIRQFAPLVDSTKAMLRPIRTLWVDTNHIVDEKRRVIYYAQGNTDTHHWVLKDTFSKECLPIENYLNSSQTQVLFDLALPYFRNTTLEHLTKVLIDESDNLSSFRQELKKIVLNFDELEMTIKEIQQDLLRPQIDKINRQFKHYKSIHGLSVIGSVGLFSLSLIKIVVPEASISEFINSLVSGSSLSGLIISELNYQKNMNSLRDNPYFLLWKIKRLE